MPCGGAGGRELPVPITWGGCQLPAGPPKKESGMISLDPGIFPSNAGGAPSHQQRCWSVHPAAPLLFFSLASRARQIPTAPGLFLDPSSVMRLPPL
ncbi:uncharacterized protein BO80DRAFT_421983 [Aspergillus ibericus CBS 121593]|uniref:Uncharacterized protein n=1 Tax=Aspergillus ibericus CBS 121593 TaxID=1448316 RepID=A0A395HC60_9EURO|nr:hypothetical protein BO80DRAFT_421983 [Aspergillus ibericus CBS 121593]RAL04735.1 hypothetical protein BO80DRAFT_421983 [Aspergillus ibericus CBS 121593]